jgi:hypothetical protein
MREDGYLISRYYSEPALKQLLQEDLVAPRELNICPMRTGSNCRAPGLGCSCLFRAEARAHRQTCLNVIAARYG